MEYEPEARVITVLGHNGFLSIFKDRGRKDDVTRLVYPVHIAKGRSQHEARAGHRAERLVNGQHILWGRIEFFLIDPLAVEPVFLPTHHARFNLENNFIVPTQFEQRNSGLEVVF